jgi:hypothetical protein
VPIHNDSTFLYTDPPSAVVFWIALEDCTSENGALVGSLGYCMGTAAATDSERHQSFLPGSHKRTTITSRFVQLPGGGTGFVPVAGADQNQQEPVDWEKEPGWREECCPAGSLVIIHGEWIPLTSAAELLCSRRLAIVVIRQRSAYVSSKPLR